jgi:hypothetical protein
VRQQGNIVAACLWLLLGQLNSEMSLPALLKLQLLMLLSLLLLLLR